MEKEKPTFNPIAMNCNQKQFDDIRRLLESSECEIEDITNFKEHRYLVNNFTNTKKLISNVFKYMSEDFNRKVYHKWDKKIFLNACGIEWEEPLKNDIVEEVINNFEKGLEHPKVLSEDGNELLFDEKGNMIKKFESEEHDPLDNLPIISDGVLMEVSDDSVNWVIKDVCAKYKNSFVAWTDHEHTISIQLWKQARPITPKTKITRKEFEQKFEIID
jgi:hypothetical protein